MKFEKVIVTVEVSKWRTQGYASKFHLRIRFGFPGESLSFMNSLATIAQVWMNRDIREGNFARVQGRELCQSAEVVQRTLCLMITKQVPNKTFDSGGISTTRRCERI